MTYTSCKTFTAQVTIGLYKGYTRELFSTQEVVTHLLKAQKAVQVELGVLLSAKMETCAIVFLGQEEPSVTLSFIQYPKFLQAETLLKQAILSLTEKLMRSLMQNRTVVVFADKTIMLEETEAIDPNIKL